MRILTFISLLVTLVACAQTEDNNDQTEANLEQYQTAYFASGCFWCLEAIFQTVDGVIEAESGYSGGETKDPTYEQVCTGKTGHAETVKVYYDSTKVSYIELVEVFFNSHDPTTKNQQGPDSGTQYRSAIFYQNSEEKRTAEELISEYLSQERFTRITTEVAAFDVFYKAEEYHQDYVKKNQEASYVKHVSKPRLEDFLKKMPKYRKDKP